MVLCPTCGKENPDGFRFCGFCTAPLDQPRDAGDEERKVVTVLFCDLVGFTAASDQADPEDVRARIRPYHQRLRTEIERYGGTVEKFIGDAVMAVFGAPLAHEDDPERAVRAGLRVLEAISDLNEADPGLDLQIRVGIETGEAVVALRAHPEAGESIVTGDVVNTASRLQGAAPVNGVAVGQGTHSATKEIFDYQGLEPVTLKGKAEPVAIYHATAARARFGTDLTRSLTSQLVGRDLERNLLTGMFERSVRDQSVQLVTVVGEPGVGKSRLVAELYSFVEDWPDLIRWRQGRCLPYGDAVTFWALGEIVKAEAGILETDPPDVAASKIDASVQDGHPDAPWLRQRLRPLVGLEAPQSAREENFAAWRAFLESLAEDRPSVFVFEDLHWADDALLAFMKHLTDYSEGVPMLLVATARPELSEKAPGFAQAARNSTRINLAPLDEAETARLISNLLESGVLPAEVHQAILQRSGGNPLYAEEFVRLLKDRGILARQGSMWTIDAEAVIPMPSGVQGLIASRLDSLSPDRKRLLQDAAVVGKVFWTGAVAAMAERDPEDVQAAMHELSRKELVRPARRSSMQGQAEYTFWHVLVRDVCYAQIPRTQRADRHRAAATWIERVAGDRVEDHAEILAAHYTAALDVARVAGRTEDLPDLAAAARRFLLMAGDRSLGLDVAEAEANYRRALELTPEGDGERAHIMARLGEALRQRARFREAEAAFAEAIEAFRARGEVREAAVAMGPYWIVLFSLGDARMRQVVDDALELLEQLPPGPELVACLSEQAAANHIQGNQRGAVEAADRAITLAGQLGLPEPVRAVGFRGLARIFLGEAQGIAEVRHAVDSAIARGLGREVAVLQFNTGLIVGFTEGPRAAVEALSESLAFSVHHGVEEFVVASACSALENMVRSGSLDEALERVPDLARRTEESGDMIDLLQVRVSELWVYLVRGEMDHRPLAEWTLAAAREAGGVTELAGVLPVVAAYGLAGADRAGALALLTELNEIPRIRDDPEYAANLPESVRTAIEAGEPALAAGLLSGVDRLIPIREHARDTARALLAEHSGEREAAAGLFAEAAERWERFETPWEQAQALLGQGRCLLALGRPGEASVPLRSAREILTALGARPALSEADTLLERAIALTS